jgi:hypothetical protein
MIKVYLKETPFTYGLAVFVVDEVRAGYRRLLQGGEGGALSVRWIELQHDDAVFVEDPAPTIVLPEDSGRALLDALVRHYQGAEDTRQLRRDYDNERMRVDNLTNALVDIARASAERGFRS